MVGGVGGIRVDREGVDGLIVGLFGDRGDGVGIGVGGVFKAEIPSGKIEAVIEYYSR